MLDFFFNLDFEIHHFSAQITNDPSHEDNIQFQCPLSPIELNKLIIKIFLLNLKFAPKFQDEDAAMF
jgi:hypothetical protein